MKLENTYCSTMALVPSPLPVSQERPLASHMTFYAAGVFGAVSSGEPRGCARATATWLPQRREGLDRGMSQGGRFRRGRQKQDLVLAGFLLGGMSLLRFRDIPGPGRELRSTLAPMACCSHFSGTLADMQPPYASLRGQRGLQDLI